MWKYYIGLFLIAGIALYFVFITDPCNSQLGKDFSDKYPDYEVLYSGAGDGSPDSVQCHITYKKPDSDQVYEDVWLYLNAGSGWGFSKILQTQKKEQLPL